MKKIRAPIWSWFRCQNQQAGRGKGAMATICPTANVTPLHFLGPTLQSPDPSPKIAENEAKFLSNLLSHLTLRSIPFFNLSPCTTPSPSLSPSFYSSPIFPPPRPPLLYSFPDPCLLDLPWLLPLTLPLIPFLLSHFSPPRPISPINTCPMRIEKYAHEGKQLDG